MPGVQGRRTLITGGTRGIGMAAARLFRERGSKVCIVARTEAALEGSGFTYVAADLSTQEGCDLAINLFLSRRHVGSVCSLISNVHTSEDKGNDGRKRNDDQPKGYISKCTHSIVLYQLYNAKDKKNQYE